MLVQTRFVSAQTKFSRPVHETLRLHAPQFNSHGHRNPPDIPLQPRILPGAPARNVLDAVVDSEAVPMEEYRSANRGLPHSRRPKHEITGGDASTRHPGRTSSNDGRLILPTNADNSVPQSAFMAPPSQIQSVSSLTAGATAPLIPHEESQRPSNVPPVPVPKSEPEGSIPGVPKFPAGPARRGLTADTAVPLIHARPLHSRAPASITAKQPGHRGLPVVCVEHPGVSRFRANNESDAGVWMTPYKSRAGRTTPNAMDSGIQPLTQLDPAYTAWWDGPVRAATGMAPNAVPVRLESLVQEAMLYSPQVLAIKTEPHVQYHVVGQEEARFDWSVFLEATFDDLKDPVGNTLALGVPGLDRLKDRNYNGALGMRRRNRHGGEFEVSQRAGHQRQNSSFFVPNPQGSSRLELQYRQPALNGAGAVVNQSQIVLARIAANASEDEVVEALQNHLLQVTEAYWALYSARAEFFQRQKLLQSSEGVLRKLSGREQVDTIPRQILRARAAVARARSGIQRTLSRVRDAEARLRLLVNSPELLNTGLVELTPQMSPTNVSDCSELRGSLDAALRNRPDISEAIRQMRSSGVRLGVSRNELLPRLDLIVSSYVSDITSTPTSNALHGQFSDARPSYTLGLEFEVPLGNRAARSRLEQRKWELKRLINVFKATVETALTDVEIAHREVATAWSEVLSRYQAMTAAQNETSYLQDRFDVLPMAEESATLLLEDLLEDLLDSFERVSDEESGFVHAQVAHAVAIIDLRREIGTLLRTREGRPELDDVQSRWIADRMGATNAAKADKQNTEAPQPATRDRTVSHTQRK